MFISHFFPKQRDLLTEKRTKIYTAPLVPFIAPLVLTSHIVADPVKDNKSAVY